MREIREYNMNGTIILGVDNGYGNVKTAHRVFPTGIIKCDSEPVLSKEYIEYDGSYFFHLDYSLLPDKDRKFRNNSYI